MKEILKFRFEYFTTPLFATLLYLGVKMIGLSDIWSILFNLVVLLEIPICFLGTRYARRLLYDVWYGEAEYEDQ